jgi:hypothetical protein
VAVCMLDVLYIPPPLKDVWCTADRVHRIVSDIIDILYRMGLGDQMQTVTDRSARASISWRLYYLRTAQRCSTSCSRPHLRAAAAASSSSSHTQQQHVINALLYFFFGQLGVVVVGLRLSRKKSFLSYSPLAPLTFICIYKTPFSFLPFDSFLSLMIITKHTHRTRKEKNITTNRAEPACVSMATGRHKLW